MEQEKQMYKVQLFSAPCGCRQYPLGEQAIVDAQGILSLYRQVKGAWMFDNYYRNTNLDGMIQELKSHYYKVQAV